MARDSFHLDNQNPYLVTTGDTYDISNLCYFKFYDWVYYLHQGELFLHSMCQLGCALGPSKYQGNEMAQYVLQSNGRVVLCCTLKHIPPEERWTKTL